MKINVNIAALLGASSLLSAGNAQYTSTVAVPLNVEGHPVALQYSDNVTDVFPKVIEGLTCHSKNTGIKVRTLTLEGTLVDAYSKICLNFKEDDKGAEGESKNPVLFDPQVAMDNGMDGWCYAGSGDELPFFDRIEGGSWLYCKTDPKYVPEFSVQAWTNGVPRRTVNVEVTDSDGATTAKATNFTLAAAGSACALRWTYTGMDGVVMNTEGACLPFTEKYKPDLNGFSDADITKFGLTLDTDEAKAKKWCWTGKDSTGNLAKTYGWPGDNDKRLTNAQADINSQWGFC